VIDLLSFKFTTFVNSPKDILCGLRYSIIEERLSSLFASLVGYGADLVFFVDGPEQEEKWKTWIKRKEQKSSFKQLLEHDADNGLLLEDLVSKYGNEILFASTLLRKKIAKKYGRCFVSYTNDADLEMASYATKNDALAILTSDTDFLIYEGNWRLWSTKDLNLENMTTMEFNRNALRTSLDLTFEQMKLFASLAGNDILRYEEVQHFHKKLGNNKEKFWNIAAYVRKFLWPISQNGIKSIVRDLSEWRYRQDLEDELAKSIKSYDIVSCINIHSTLETQNFLKCSYFFRTTHQTCLI
jgi:hypothetical protein